MHSLKAGFRAALSAAAVGVAALLVAGNAAAQQTTVNFLGASAADAFAPVIKAFETANPGIKVRYQQVPFDDLNVAVESRVGQGDSTIDIFAADTPRIPAFAAKGYLLGLDSYRGQFEKMASTSVDVEQVSHKGKIYAFPMWNSTQLMVYNRDLLKKAGIAAPGAAKEARLTWEQLLDQARLAQKAGAKWGAMFEQVDRFYQLQPLFESAGAGPGLKGEGLLQPDLLGEPWVKTAQWYADLFESGIAPRGVSPAQTKDLFINGELAFFVGGPWILASLEATKGLNFGVAPMPYFKGGKPVTPTGSWALALNPKAANLEAARKFAEFATLSEEGAYLTVSVLPLPPVNKAAMGRYADRFKKLSEKTGPIMDIIGYETRETAVGRPRTIGYVAFETVMNRAFSDIRNGAKVRATLQQAQDQLTPMLARIR